MLTPQGSTVQDTLFCDHEEADTKLIAYASVASVFANGVMVRSSSGDIDVVVLFVCNRFRCKVYLDNYTGKDRKILNINNNSSLSNNKKKHLLAIILHLVAMITGYYFISPKVISWNDLA